MIAAQASAHAADPTARTELIVLGTGTPIPDPERTGPAVAIVVDGVAYLFDAGAGIVRRAAKAAGSGVTALEPSKLGRVFLTHLHSDHTLGLADLLFTPWIQGRKEPLEVFGPPGTNRLVHGIVDGNDEDVRERVQSAGGPSAEGWRAHVHEITEGEVFRDERVQVRAFAVPHSRWKHALGYRIRTPDRVIVLSGDTRRSDAIARECKGCDILVHEVYSDAGFAKLRPERQPYHAQAHTSASQLGDIATTAQPKLLVLYHQLFFGVTEEALLQEVRARFAGKVKSAHDLDRF
jgi:ribonuclease BN (tRNA processing enzyme)